MAAAVAVHGNAGVVCHDPVAGVTGIAKVVVYNNIRVVDMDVNIVDGKAAGLVIAEIDGGIFKENGIIAGFIIVSGIENIDVSAVRRRAGSGHGRTVQFQYRTGIHCIAPAVFVADRADVAVVKGNAAVAAVQAQELAIVAFRRQLTSIQHDVAAEEIDGRIIAGAGRLGCAFRRDEPAVIKLHIAADEQFGDSFAIVIEDSILVSGNFDSST